MRRIKDKRKRLKVGGVVKASGVASIFWMQDAGCKRQEARDKRQEARGKRQETRGRLVSPCRMRPYRPYPTYGVYGVLCRSGRSDKRSASDVL